MTNTSSRTTTKMTTSQKAIESMRRNLNRPLSRENELHLKLVPEPGVDLEANPADHQEAVRVMQNPDRFLTLQYCRQLTSADKRNPVETPEYSKPGCMPELKRFERTFIRRLAKKDIPFYCVEMFREPGRQVELYIRGESPDMPGYSAHEEGRACDLLHADYGMRLPPRCWEVIGHIGQEIALTQQLPIVWGGMLRPAHWELMPG